MVRYSKSDDDEEEGNDDSVEECDNCNGTGMAECPMEWGEDDCPSECPACGGGQKVICSDCDGSGERPDWAK